MTNKIIQVLTEAKNYLFSVVEEADHYVLRELHAAEGSVFGTPDPVATQISKRDADDAEAAAKNHISNNLSDNTPVTSSAVLPTVQEAPAIVQPAAEAPESDTTLTTPESHATLTPGEQQ